MTALAKLTSDRVVEDKAADLKQFGLDQPKFETGITTKDGETRTLLIGEDAPAGRVTYAMLQGDPRVFTIPGYVKDIVDRKPRDLRDKRLITMPADKITRVDFSGKQHIVFVRDNGGLAHGRAQANARRCQRHRQLRGRSRDSQMERVRPSARIPSRPTTATLAACRLPP